MILHRFAVILHSSAVFSCHGAVNLISARDFSSPAHAILDAPAFSPIALPRASQPDLSASLLSPFSQAAELLA
jgi:hypothetical protein